MRKYINLGLALKVGCVGFVVAGVLRLIYLLYAFDPETCFATDGGVLAGCCLAAVILSVAAEAAVCVLSTGSLDPAPVGKNPLLGVAALVSGGVLAGVGVHILRMTLGAGDAPSYLLPPAAQLGVPGLVFAGCCGLFGLVQLFCAVCFFTGRDPFARLRLLYLAGVAWGLSYLVMVYVHFGHAPSFSENFFSVLGGVALLLALFYLTRVTARAEAAWAALRLFIAGIAGVVLVLIHSLANFTARVVGVHYTGEMPVSVQLATVVVALFLLTYLSCYKRQATPYRTPEHQEKEPDRSGRRFRRDPGQPGKRFRAD